MKATRCPWLTLVVLLAMAAPARGAPGDDGVPIEVADASASPVAPAAVEIAVVGASADLERVQKLFGAGGLAGATPTWVRLARFDPLAVVLEHRAPAQRTVRCWVDMSSPDRIRLFFAAGSGERFLVRVIPVSSHSDEMDQQALAEVLERSVSALLDDEQAGLDRAQAQALLASRWRSETTPPAARVTPTKPPVPRSRIFHLSGAVLYATQALPLARPGGNTVALLHGPGLSLTGSIQGPQRRWGIWAAAQRQFAHRELTDDVGFDFRTTATRTGLELQQTIGDGAGARRFGISYLLFRVGTGVDLVRLTPRSGAVDHSATLTSARWSNSLVFMAAVGAGLQVGRRASLAATVLADFLPTAVHYDYAAEGHVTPVVSAGRLRPGFALELAADVL